MTTRLLLALGLLLVPSLAGGGDAIDQLEVCLSCHDEVVGSLQAAVPHPPVRDGACTACHNPHVARFAGLLRERPAPLCAGCHAAVSEEVKRPVIHLPVAQGRCADCHQAHGGAHSKLLVRPGVELCAGCHAEVAEWQARPVVHSPFRRGRCEICHPPHGADHAGLLVRSAGSLCSTCHLANPKFQAAHQGYPVDKADCRQCHDPHASVRRGLLRQSVHSPFADGECEICHAPPAAAEPFRVTGVGRLCGECHDAEVAACRDAPFPHVAAAGEDCVACHNPHTGAGEGLLRRPREALCLSCHDPGGSGSGQPGRYRTHGQGLACTTCHAPHGGDRPLLFGAEVNSLCSACHADQHRISHPMGEAARDPRNGQPLDCLSCHGIHDAPYPDNLHRAGDRDLCVACHQDIVGGQR